VGVAQVGSGQGQVGTPPTQHPRGPTLKSGGVAWPAGASLAQPAQPVGGAAAGALASRAYKATLAHKRQARVRGDRQHEAHGSQGRGDQAAQEASHPPRLRKVAALANSTALAHSRRRRRCWRAGCRRRVRLIGHGHQLGGLAVQSACGRIVGPGSAVAHFLGAGRLAEQYADAATVGRSRAGSGGGTDCRSARRA
jgi:hypothetical protein